MVLCKTHHLAVKHFRFEIICSKIQNLESKTVSVNCSPSMRTIEMLFTKLAYYSSHWIHSIEQMACHHFSDRIFAIVYLTLQQCLQFVTFAQLSAKHSNEMAKNIYRGAALLIMQLTLQSRIMHDLNRLPFMHNTQCQHLWRLCHLSFCYL